MKWAYKIQQEYSGIAIKSHNEYGKLVGAANKIERDYGITMSNNSFANANSILIRKLSEYLSIDAIKSERGEEFAFASVGEKIDSYKSRAEICMEKTEEKLFYHFPDLILDMENLNSNLEIISKDRNITRDLKNLAKLYLAADRTYNKLDLNLKELMKFRHNNVFSR